MRIAGLLMLLACDKTAAQPEAPDDTGADVNAACSAEERAQPVTWRLTAQPFLLTYCSACHAADSPNRFGAPAGVSFDTEAEAIAWGPRIRARTVELGDMPVGGGVIEEDLIAIEAWLDCGDTR